MRKTLLPVLALALVTMLACGFGSQTTPGGSGTSDRGTSATPDPDAETPEPETTAAETPVAAASSTAPTGSEPLTCAQLQDAELGNVEHPYNGQSTPIRLVGGSWSGDGMVVRLQSCAVGDLTGDDAADAVGVMLMDGGGTGKFWQIVFFGNIDARPHYVSTTDIGDRTPVEAVSVSGQRLKVVYLMRPEDPSSTASLIRRTATYRLSGSLLVETGHTDVPA
ncbi:hypothetical protein [Micromonospora sagamiensis]|uniref:Lipoprotein n=1 Tax=Micromonospora sagamiensis TaxID=47875 RepID=A0A562WBZ7_9ACTN|nr:hypothetical protein [Micromonospora sagamiensis]TWJ27144.1 hypothetical protein JD81_00631 [Micromonospora sagamiensis]BCL13961.1 hypothetical protein GCM10017556_17000 [Micromonospora sagamiensis]